MRISKYRRLILAFLFLARLAAIAQIQQAWVAHYNNEMTNGQHQALKMALDGAGNVYVCGFSANTNGGTGYATLKYASNGNLKWVARFDSTNFPSAQPAAFCLDGQTNVLVTGTAITVKYDNNGNLLWTNANNAVEIAADSSNNVYITGINSNSATTKLTSSGSNLWTQTYSSYGACFSQTVNIDASNNVYICGSAIIAPPGYILGTAVVVFKYDANGTTLWSTEIPQNANFPVQVDGSALDAKGDLFFVFTVGGGGSSYDTLAYDARGTALWSSYNPTPTVGGSIGLSLSPDGVVVVTGNTQILINRYSEYPGISYGTLGITNGGVAFADYYPAQPQRISSGNAVACDKSNNTYVTGFSAEATGTNNIATIAYDANGNQLWLQRYTGLGYGAVGNAIAADNNGNVYVAGYENVPGGGTEMVLIKYSPVTLQHQSNGNFLLRAQGGPNEPFDIQATTNLQTWLDLGAHDADTNGLLQYLDTNMLPYRFYLAIPQ